MQTRRGGTRTNTWSGGVSLQAGLRRTTPPLSKQELQALPVQSIAKQDCLLFMWVSSPLLDEAIELGRAWGFQYKTVAFVWHKGASVVGHYTLSECEMCLVSKRGRIRVLGGLGARSSSCTSFAGITVLSLTLCGNA